MHEGERIELAPGAVAVASRGSCCGSSRVPCWPQRRQRAAARQGRSRCGRSPQQLVSLSARLRARPCRSRAAHAGRARAWQISPQQSRWHPPLAGTPAHLFAINDLSRGPAGTCRLRRKGQASRERIDGRLPRVGGVSVSAARWVGFAHAGEIHAFAVSTWMSTRSRASQTEDRQALASSGARCADAGPPSRRTALGRGSPRADRWTWGCASHKK